MEATQKWLSEQLYLYKYDSLQTLGDMLVSTNKVIEQYINNKDSKLAQGILQSCMEHNKLFFESINQESL